MKFAVVFPTCVVLFKTEEGAKAYVRRFIGGFADDTWSIKPVRLP